MSKAVAFSTNNTGPLCVILCDIDHFKPINDQYGHGAGDRVLATVARLMKNTVRSTDSVIRWGGEEFLIVLPDCAEDSALVRAERIRQAIDEHRDDEVGGVTVSFGVAIQSSDESGDNVVARADKALYQAKEQGRNRVVLAEKSFG